MSRKSLRSLGDLQQFLSAETRTEIDATPAVASTATAEPASDNDNPTTGDAPVATIRVTYNISASKLVRQFLTDNVLAHYMRAEKPVFTGTLGSCELDMPSMDATREVIALINAATIPTLKYYTTTPDAIAATTTVSASAPAPVAYNMPEDMVGALSEELDAQQTKAYITPDDLAEADAIAAELDAADAQQNTSEPDTADRYQGRRVLPVIEPETPAASAYPDLRADAPTVIYHIATATVYAEYPTLAEAEAAFAASTSPRKAEFTLAQQIHPAPSAPVATPSVRTAPDADVAGPYTLTMLDGTRWDTIDTYPTRAAAVAWLRENTTPDTFDADEWALYDITDEECDLSDVHAVATPDADDSGTDDSDLTTLDIPLVSADDSDTSDLQPVELLDVFDTLTPPTAPASAPPVASTVAPLDDRADRDRMIEHIVGFYKLLGIAVRSDLHQLSTEALDDLLHVLESNNGGSLEAATVIRTVEAQYAQFIKSGSLALKMRTLDAQGAQYFKHVQRIAAAVGDVSIAGMKGTAYHEQLKGVVAHLSVLNDSVMHLGELLGLRIPVDGLSSAGGDIAITEGLPFNPKICMYVLEIFRSNITNLQTKNKITQEDLRRANTARAELEAALRRLKDDTAATVDAMRQREAYYTAQLAPNNATYWVLRTPSKKYLSKLNPDAPVRNARELGLNEDADVALRFTSPARAKATMEQLAETNRFRKVRFTLYRVSEVEEV